MDTIEISLDGRVALVTGGSRGIGRAIALAFADAGADIVVSSRNRPHENYPTLEKVADEIIAKGRRGLAVAANVAKIEEVKALVEKVKGEFDRIDILVNNAGTGTPQHLTPVIDTDEWAWDLAMNVNLKGPFFLSQLVARIMREQGGGNIINVASVAGVRPDPPSIYAVSKSALITLTKVMAKQWAQYNIRVNAIAPGPVRTRLMDTRRSTETEREAVAKLLALGRVGVPEDVAGAALYLASDMSSWVTGITMILDGGELIGPAPELEEKR